MRGRTSCGKPAAVPLARPVVAVTVTVAGMPVDALFAGNAPGLVGVMQINAPMRGGFLTPGRTEIALTVVAATVSVWLK